MFGRCSGGVWEVFRRCLKGFGRVLEGVLKV